jgi:1-acyl-sn-glycerol-3-phosphate acyltransferase
MVRNLAVGLLFVVFVVLAAPVLLVAFLARAPRLVIGYGKGAVRLACWILGFDVVVEGRERVGPTEQFVFMANHLSLIDGPLLFLLIPRPLRVILKKSIFRLPVIGAAMAFIGFVPVDRMRTTGGQRAIARAARLMKEKGCSFLIFPEGTRSRDGRLQAFRRGGFFLALESGAAIAPISVQGTYELMPRGQKYIRRGRIRVAFHDPLPVAGLGRDDIPALMDRARAAVAAGLEEGARARGG